MEGVHLTDQMFEHLIDILCLNRHLGILENCRDVELPILNSANTKCFNHTGSINVSK